MEYVSGHKRETMAGKTKHGFTKDKSDLTNLTAYYDEMVVFVGEGRAKNLIYLDFLPWLFTLIFHLDFLPGLTLNKAFNIVFHSILV